MILISSHPPQRSAHPPKLQSGSEWSVRRRSRDHLPQREIIMVKILQFRTLGMEESAKLITVDA